jgi:hypothetical protein
MDANKQRERMEAIYYALGNMKLTKKQRTDLSAMLRSAFVNGFHAALVEYAGVAGENKRTEIASQNETVQHILFLAQESAK